MIQHGYFTCIMSSWFKKQRKKKKRQFSLFFWGGSFGLFQRELACLDHSGFQEITATTPPFGLAMLRREGTHEKDLFTSPGASWEAEGQHFPGSLCSGRVHHWFRHQPRSPPHQSQGPGLCGGSKPTLLRNHELALASVAPRRKTTMYQLFVFQAILGMMSLDPVWWSMC